MARMAGGVQGVRGGRGLLTRAGLQDSPGTCRLAGHSVDLACEGSHIWAPSWDPGPTWVSSVGLLQLGHRGAGDSGDLSLARRMPLAKVLRAAGRGALGRVGHGAGPRAGPAEERWPLPHSVPMGPCSGQNTVLRDSHRGRAAFHLRRPPSVPLHDAGARRHAGFAEPGSPRAHPGPESPEGGAGRSSVHHLPSPPGRGADPAALPGRREPPGGKALHTCRSRAARGARSPRRCSGRLGRRPPQPLAPGGAPPD